LIYGGAGLIGAAVGYLWGRADRPPTTHNVGAKVRSHLLGFTLCVGLYIILDFAFQVWIPMLLVESPGVYRSGTFILFAAIVQAAVWGVGFLILTRLLTLLVRTGSRT
jgi:hypothetical protein